MLYNYYHKYSIFNLKNIGIIILTENFLTRFLNFL